MSIRNNEIRIDYQVGGSFKRNGIPIVEIGCNLTTRIEVDEASIVAANSIPKKRVLEHIRAIVTAMLSEPLTGNLLGEQKTDA